MATDFAVLEAARRRGWTFEMIAAACGASHQAVSERFRRARTGGVRRFRKSKKGPRLAAACARCGRVVWRKPSEYVEPNYCSQACKGLNSRRLKSDAEVLAAIASRRGGESWKNIAKRCGISVQALQHRIVALLHRRGLLTRATLLGIWWPPVAPWRQRTPSWAWLAHSAKGPIKTVLRSL